MIYPELKGPALEAYRSMVTELKARAQNELGLPPEEIVIRPLRPDDFESNENSSTQDTSWGQTTVTWDAVYSGETIADNRFVGICGFYAGSTHGSQATMFAQVRVTRKGAVTRYWNVAPIEFWKHRTCYFDDPVVIDQNTTFKIETWTRDGASITQWGFLGAVAEKRGLLINP